MWKQYPKSKRLFEEARKTVASGVATLVQSRTEPHPIFMAQGKGSRLYDEDGNEYIDYLLNYGPAILGHAPDAVNLALERQLRLGYAYGQPHRLQQELAKSLIDCVPAYEMVNFSNTGTEAVQASLNAARAATRKTRFIKFEGQYHGWMDNIFVSFFPVPGEDPGPSDRPRAVRHLRACGRPAGILNDMIVLPWNDLAAVERTLETDRDVAAIITEPIMNNCGVIMPRPGYLEGLRALCDRRGVMLIFDEVITGQRVALGGGQELFGVTPDISCGSKAIGGGFPIMAFGGRKDVMKVVAEGLTLHSGTFNGNAVCCAAALAVMAELTADNAAAILRINTLGGHLRDGLAATAKKHGFKVVVEGPGAAFCLSFRESAPWDMRSAFQQPHDVRKYLTFRRLLLDRGVHIFPIDKRPWYTSAAHTEEDIEETLRVADEAFSILKTIPG
ncbi:MAG: aspartate aminotransferase family protein [Planctomycetota bacterium]